MSGSKIAGVDVGGTFTDFFVFDSANGQFETFKISSNRGNEAQAFAEGLLSRGGKTGDKQTTTSGAEYSSIIHGTTAGTNALLERKGANVGLITTAGFRDVLEMRRRDRPNTWGLWGDFVPLVERDMRIEVNERILADGTIRQPLDPDEFRNAARILLDNGAQALAIIFINAYSNDANEQLALQAAHEIWPNDYIAISSAILPEIREFERTSTTVINAFLQPVIGGYLGTLEETLKDNSFTGSFHIVQSNGGIMSTNLARQLPARTALSGPAAGAIAATSIAKAAGYSNIITGDLGGTSFDVALIKDGAAAQAAQTTIDFGIVIRTPMIEITTIGAGGGSIARVDASGLLQVGPESAGSIPGPVCYGNGNRQPTLTDANVVLGRINADAPIGGRAGLDVEGARQAILREVAEPLNLELMAAAEAIVRLANAHMAGAIRLASIERGNDPGDFSFMPFGGGGALHAGQLLQEIGLKSVIVPRFPGITSALGCIIADLRHDRVETLNLMLEELDCTALRQRMTAAAKDVASVVNDGGVTIERTEVLFELDMQYAGQTHAVSVSLPARQKDQIIKISEHLIRDAFELEYRAQFNRLLDGASIRIVSLRSIAIGRRPVFDWTALAPDDNASIATARRPARKIWFGDTWQDTPVYARLDLPIGAKIEGPALLEQPDSTIIIDPGLQGRVDSLGNVIIDRMNV